MSEKVSSNLFLELGQMLKIIAPSNSVINDKNYYIEYLDNNIVKLINDTNLNDELEIGITNGRLNDESIEKIIILATPNEKGYARQHNLVPDNWITIEFGGDIPTIINGQITDLDEDEIELSLYNSEQKIYINFNYKGIPLELPIIRINEFIPPELMEKEESPLEIIDDDIDSDEDLELIIDSDEIKQNVQDLFISLDEIQIGDESLGEITEMIKVKESEKRYGIETQTQDILDELLAEYPTNRRTRNVLNNIHILIERFKQLRRKFSKFNETGNAESILKKGANYKPLIQNLKSLNKKLYWILPVAKNTHKLFDLDIPVDEKYSDAQLMQFRFAQNNIIEAQGHYKSNTVPDSQNKYIYLMQNINPYFTPFLETSDMENIITKKEVKENIDVLINNLENFESHMVKKENINAQKYVIDKYNLGLTRLENPDIKNKHSKAFTVPLTRNDTIDLVGFMRLQEPYIRYSHINLPNTNIYNKSNLHFFNYFYFDILKKWAEGEEIIIKEGQEPNTNKEEALFLKKKEELNPFDTEGKKAWKNARKLFGFNSYFSFEERRNFIDRESLDVKTEIYEQFLENMIPKTRVLFEFIKKYIQNGTSYTKVIEYLEPFMIYDDDISYKQYETITEFIFEEIQKHKKILIQQSKEYLKFIRQNKSYFISTILPKLIKTDKQDIFDKKNYNINDSIDTEDSLKKIINFDSGRLFNISLSLSQLTFAQPIDIEEKVENEIDNLDNKIFDEKESPEVKECETTKKLVKRYINLDELTEDNNSPVFVDKKYDETPYDIGEEWKRNNSIIMASADDNKLVIEELKNFLIENNGVDKNKALIDASAMILGSREVQEGEYAYLDLQDGNIKYYLRQDNIWKYDKSLSGLKPEQINFCNIKENCFKIKDTCSNLESSKDMIKINILGDIEKRFEEELVKSIQQLKTDLLADYKYRETNLQSLKKLKIYKLIKRDLLQKKIGSTLEERDIIISPYESLRNIILSENDIVKKFANIEKFINQYCRVANNDEDGHWYYCIDTDIKLLPSFYEELVNGFYSDNYLLTLEKIKKERGEKSDDGDKWVDKYSGYYISNDIALDYSEGYDKSGYKVKSREIIEEGMAEKLNKARFQGTKQTYATDLAKRVERILKTLDEKLYISTKSEYNFIIKIVMESMNSNVPDETQYKELFAQKSKSGKKLITFEKKHDQILIYSIISAYIIAVQSSIPGIITKKVFGDCKKSFSGFPIDGNADLTFIEYLSCIIFTFRTKNRPWNIIPIALSNKSKKRRKNYAEIQEKFVEKVKNFMTTKILHIDSVEEKLNFKREWNKKNKSGEIIPTEFNVQQWTSFLPPLTPVTVRSLNNIGPTFQRTLTSRMKEGSYEQFVHLWALYGKIVSYSFSIIESVQRAINKEPVLLETKAGIPFLENACCNNGEPNTNLYFSQKETSIKTHNNIIKNLIELYNKFKYINKGPFLSITKDTKMIYPPVSKTFSKETIYLAFIKFCKFNSGIQLQDDLKRICGNNECSFRFTDSLKEKIIAMEADSLNYSIDTLNILLNIINRQNILQYDLDPPVTTEKLQLEKCIQYLKGKNNLICHPKLLTHLQNIVDRFDVSIVGEDDEITIGFKQYLDKINQEMSTSISEKMMEHGELSRKFKDLFVEYTPIGEVSTAKLKTKRAKFILNWDLIGDNNYITREDETGFIIFRMMKEFVINICKVFPNIIINEVNFKNRYVPKHWYKGSKKLSDRHKNEIIGFMLKEGEAFAQFYKDPTIKPVLEYVLKNNEDILMLIQAIPFYSGIVNGKKPTGSIFDGEILKKLAYYFMLCSFSLYISAFSSDLRVDTVENEKFLEEAEDGEDLDIIITEREQLEKSTCSLLAVYLQKIGEYKKLLNVSAETINKNVLKVKTKEKEQIVKRLGDLTVEEREIEDIMKNSSLGDWSLGRTKAIFEYDDEQYDKEREKMEKDALLELQSGGLDDVSEFIGEIYNVSSVLVQMENDDVARRINAEINNLDELAEDDDYGDRDNIDYM